MEQSRLSMPLLAASTPSAYERTARSIARKPVPNTDAYHTLGIEAAKARDGAKSDSVEAFVVSPVSTDRRTTMTGRLPHIALLCALLVLPLCGVTIALVVIVYQNLLPPSRLASSQPCAGLVVNYGASQLTSLSTWISTVATLLAPAFMALLAYPVARYMTRRLDLDHNVTRLPSPYQTGLLIELLGGGLVSVWSSLRYMISRRRVKLSPLLCLSSAILLCGLLLGLLTQLADFWLHRATDSILYPASKPITSAEYGRQLSDYCQNYYATNGASKASCTGIRVNGTALNAPCSVVCGEYDFYPTGYSQGFLLANSLSANSTLAVTDVTNVTDVSDQIESQGLRNLVLLLPSNVDTTITWTTTTVGVSTHCEYLFDKCDYDVWGAGVQFTCGPEVPPTGYNSSGPIPFNSSGTGGIFGTILTTLKTSRTDPPNPAFFGNPWIFGLAMRLPAIVSEKDLPDNLQVGDENIFTLLQCNTTTYDVEYSMGDQYRNLTSSVASSAITVSKISPSSTNVHHTVQGHILTANGNAQDYLQKAMLASIFSAEGSGQVLPRFEQEYGKTALSFAAPSFENIPTIQRHVVDQRVVSCVRKAPLWSLVGLVCLYIVLTVILTILAIVSSSSKNVRSAQSQLSVAGLAARAFEEQGFLRRDPPVTRMEDLFQEFLFAQHKQDLEDQVEFRRNVRRVGFRKAGSGHWEYDVITRGEIEPSAENGK